jgi:hypothetical protein
MATSLLQCAKKSRLYSSVESTPAYRPSWQRPNCARFWYVSGVDRDRPCKYASEFLDAKQVDCQGGTNCRNLVNSAAIDQRGEHAIE